MTFASTSFRLDRPLPWAATAARNFLAARALDGVEGVGADRYARSLVLPSGPALVEAIVGPDAIEVEVVGTAPSSPDDAARARQAVRRVFDLDRDVAAVDRHLADDPLLRPSVVAEPGRPSPGAADGPEMVVRAVVGQQVSVAGAKTVIGRLAASLGARLPPDLADHPIARRHGLTGTFPAPAAFATTDPADLPMPRSRGAALVAVNRVLADGAVDLDPGTDPEAIRAALLSVKGIGPWTVDYVLMRALGDPDVFLPTDLVVRRALARLGADGNAAEHAEAWRPFRSYALHHLWAMS